MTILVTGATGSVGRLVVDHLLAAGATDVRALTNKPEKAALPMEVDVVKGYIGRPETLPPALEGVDRMYLAPLTETVHEVLALARTAGVQHVVDLAGPEGNWWHAIEVAVEESGVAWTHLDAGEFMENSLIWADQIRTTGQVRDAYPDAANAPIAMDDIAAVAAVALLEDGHVGKAYELTGPESITRADMVRCIGVALGRDIPYVELTREQAVEQLSKAMGEHADWYLEGKAALVAHPQQAVATVAQVTGRPAKTFAQWAVKHVDAFRVA
ncbi:NAD(P)H-binding protein [Actinopolymorpha sp. B11F2]|uniref:NAD(P)H-binding protein n=1 Tax=Actinopolymorpha sp. B11F2 TaxID=3160862 RepID=UPI0032E4852D